MKRPDNHSSSKVAEELRLINVRHHGSSRETSMVDERLVEPLRLRVEFEDWRRGPWRDMAAAAAAAAAVLLAGWLVVARARKCSEFRPTFTARWGLQPLSRRHSQQRLSQPFAPTNADDCDKRVGRRQARAHAC